MRFALIGKASADDLQTVSAAARQYAPEISFTSLQKLDDPRQAATVDCYLSFAEFSAEVVRDLAYRLPLGVGERVPFFQQVSCDTANFETGVIPVSGFFHTPISACQAHTICAVTLSSRRLSAQKDDLINEVMKYRKQRRQLIDMGIALSAINDLEKLLELLLAQSRDIVNADAGSIYVRERQGPGKNFGNRLRFRVAQNDTVDISSQAKTFWIDLDETTIAGYVAYTGNPLNIEDVYELSESSPYHFGRSFDREFGYRTKSMLTIPLKNLEGVVVGVIQLMNRKSDASTVFADVESIARGAAPFSFSDIECISSIGSLAAVSIERAILHEDLQQVFEGFLDSSIAAVDERDRVTSGHSRRVMGYAMAFVDAVNECSEGPFAGVRFDESRRRQFKFAALLHDIGKIGVPERLLNKETRLSAEGFEALRARTEYIHFALRHAPSCVESWKCAAELRDDLAFLERINAAGFLPEEDQRRLTALAAKTYVDSSGVRQSFLRDAELRALSVSKGNLTLEERERINSHALATYRILSKISWTGDLIRIPDIASHHHEKLDGSGYPHHLSGDEISLESRILAVIDIYEALVSQDRPYKPAMPCERALEILRAEAAAGRLDTTVIDFFEARGIHRLFAPRAAQA